MTARARLLALFIFLGGSGSALAARAAAPPTQVRAEIEYLLGYLERSGCEFNRNGSWYDAKTARAHLEQKYAYLLDKNLVARTEDFVARAATNSSVSGKPYLVKCGSAAPVPSAQWFGVELKRHRQAHPAGGAGTVR